VALRFRVDHQRFPSGPMKTQVPRAAA